MFSTYSVLIGCYSSSRDSFLVIRPADWWAFSSPLLTVLDLKSSIFHVHLSSLILAPWPALFLVRFFNAHYYGFVSSFSAHRSFLRRCVTCSSLILILPRVTSLSHMLGLAVRTDWRLFIWGGLGVWLCQTLLNTGLIYCVVHKSISPFFSYIT